MPYDLTFTKCFKPNDPCHELRRPLLEQLEEEMGKVMWQASNALDDRDRPLYEKQCRLREVYDRICRMDCNTLRRRYSQLEALTQACKNEAGSLLEKIDSYQQLA